MWRILLSLLILFQPVTALAVEVQLSHYATPNDGLDDTAGLLAAIDNADVVRIGPGDWHFVGPLINGVHYKFQRCRIIGPADEFAAQHQEEGRVADRYVSRLNISGLAANQYWINWKPAPVAAPTYVDRGGPMEFSNTSAKITGDGNFMSLGDFEATGAGALAGDFRKFKMSGFYVNCNEQQATLTGDNLPTYAHNAMIRFVRGYDIQVRDVGIRGGGTSLLIHGCDRATIDNMHIMLSVNGIVSEDLFNHATVPNTISRIFIENCIGTAFVLNSCQTDMLRVENGYLQNIGPKTITGSWTIPLGGNRVSFVGVDCLAKFFHGQLVSLNRDTFLVVDQVDATGFTFEDATSHCYFAAAQSGASLTAYYGVGLIGMGDRFSVGQWSVDYNKPFPGMPLAAFLPYACTMPIGPYINGISSNINATNRPVVVGHSSGAVFNTEASVWFQNALWSPRHPLHHPGIAPQPLSSGNRWLGTSATDNRSRDGRFWRPGGGERWAILIDNTLGGSINYAAPTGEVTYSIYCSTPTGTLTIWDGVSQRNFAVVQGWQNVVASYVPAANTHLLYGPNCSIELPYPTPSMP